MRDIEQQLSRGEAARGGFLPPLRGCLVVMLVCCGATIGQTAVRWRHPAGIVTDDTIKEVKAKIATHAWAKETYARRKRALERWVSVPSARLRQVFPKQRGNVYHNFSCPKDRVPLVFDPFSPDRFTCPACGTVYAPTTDAGVYQPGTRYHGTMYDGWACNFYLRAGAAAADMGLIARVEGPVADRYAKRGVEILTLYADTIEHLKTKIDPNPQFSVLLTYHREGDNKVLNDLACAYEMLRDQMTARQRARFEKVVLQRMYDDVMREDIYRYNHNNLYQWHRTILQVGLCLERDDLIDWSFGYGAFSPDRQPEHHSIRRLVATHFKPDGGYWGLCSGYHLYPLHAFCELAVVSHHLSRMDPRRFPPRQYDLTDRSSDGGKVIHRALQWFLSMAMPDRTMPTIGDSMVPRSGMDDYCSVAEVGYRFFGIKAIGDYASFRAGQRHWAGLLYGAPEVTGSGAAKTSSYLSSGWVSLRNRWRGNRLWVGLNALLPGSSHQHADRLTLLFYSHGKLLALEKATPYNESVTRVLGTLSPSHNTVTVDKRSQQQGEALRGAQIPRVAYFFPGPVAKFAELQGDHIYTQTTAYRRSVALIEDMAVDRFRVEGGKTHDWMVHHAGTASQLSVPTSPATFSPAKWLYNGGDRVVRGKTDGRWNARWVVDGVTSRLTMLGAKGTSVFSMETYPIDNAVITPRHPACQTLCVRRHDDSPFLAVWDAWRAQPNLHAIDRGGDGESLKLRTADNTYYLRFGTGHTRFDKAHAIESDAVFCILRNRDAVQFVNGRYMNVRAPAGTLRVATNRAASVAVEFRQGTAIVDIAGAIQYDTRDGRDHYREIPAVDVKIDGDLWHVVRRRVARPEPHLAWHALSPRRRAWVLERSEPRPSPGAQGVPCIRGSGRAVHE